ncbi:MULTISPECIES: AbrB/MazE/SpoVT family DNA-binding domain-containing protein [Noviherbaspirillum]|uniref:AbrB/MazE/SpoVT family DNA-binding domain-containing protein n=1 Tax=Noviherbaspirillum TaxID=1344552 RepID=UPI0038B27DA5
MQVERPERTHQPCPLTASGKIIIPREIRERLGLKPSDQVRFFLGEDGTLVLRPQPPPSGKQ